MVTLRIYEILMAIVFFAFLLRNVRELQSPIDVGLWSDRNLYSNVCHLQ